MTIQIKLDTQALNILFPEGSEARVELTRAVVQNMIKSLSQKSVVTIAEEVLVTMTPLFDEMRKAAKEEIDNLLIRKFGSTELSDFVKEKIKKEVELNFSLDMKKVINNAIGELKTSFHENIEKLVTEKSESLLQSLDPYIRTCANKHLSAKVDAIIKSTIGTE